MVEGCENNQHVKKMCNQHYIMWKKHGDPLAGAYRMPFKKAIDHGDGTRTCTKCNERLPISSFHKDKSATDGLKATCKKCRINRVKDWYQDNIQERREKASSRRKNNVESERQKDNERYERDREKRIALATEHSHRRRARKLNTVVEKGISVLSLKKKHGTQCHYCLKEMDFSKGVGRKFNSDMATIEHLIPLARGGEHTFENTVLACRFCNISRGAKSQEDFEEYRKNTES
jgi:5-methylcytosine-specific restriction endonuclease McrA